MIIGYERKNTTSALEKKNRTRFYVRVRSTERFIATFKCYKFKIEIMLQTT